MRRSLWPAAAKLTSPASCQWRLRVGFSFLRRSQLLGYSDSIDTMATARTASRAIARSFNRRPTPHRLVASSSRCSAPPSLFTSSSRRHLATHADSSSAETSAPSAPKAQKGKPKLERGDYKKVTKEDVEFFRSVLGEGGVISSLEGEGREPGGQRCVVSLTTLPLFFTGDAAATSQSELDSFNNDWMGKYFGTSKVVLKPRTTEQVSRVVAHCVKVSA